jgi:formiminotetrahydrofolate cyclodeaminase
MINVSGIKDSKFVVEKTGEAEKLKDRAAKFCAEILEVLDNRKD